MLCAVSLVASKCYLRNEFRCSSPAHGIQQVGDLPQRMFFKKAAKTTFAEFLAVYLIIAFVISL